MKTFFDSSAFAKRYVEEEGSDTVEEICLNTTSLALCIVCVPEIISALNRQLREKNITRRNYALSKDRLMEDIQDAIILNITPSVVNRSIHLLEKNKLRAMDSLHVACALEWEAALFVSSDQRQVDAARKAGLKIQFV